MTHASDTVLVLGGGVAGMAAAQMMGDQNIHVHLVETSDRLGDMPHPGPAWPRMDAGTAGFAWLMTWFTRVVVTQISLCI